MNQLLAIQEFRDDLIWGMFFPGEEMTTFNFSRMVWYLEKIFTECTLLAFLDPYPLMSVVDPS